MLTYLCTLTDQRLSLSPTITLHHLLCLAVVLLSPYAGWPIRSQIHLSLNLSSQISPSSGIADMGHCKWFYVNSHAYTASTEPPSQSNVQFF